MKESNNKTGHFHSCYQAYNHVTKKSRCTIPHFVSGTNFPHTNKETDKLTEYGFYSRATRGGPVPGPPLPPFGQLTLTTLYYIMLLKNTRRARKNNNKIFYSHSHAQRIHSLLMQPHLSHKLHYCLNK